MKLIVLTGRAAERYLDERHKANERKAGLLKLVGRVLTARGQVVGLSRAIEDVASSAELACDDSLLGDTMQPTSEKEALTLANTALDAINQATNKGATALAAVKTRIDELLEKIAASDSLEEAKSLAAKSSEVLASVDGFVASLEALANPASGGTPTEPVPVPMPEPPTA